MARVPPSLQWLFFDSAVNFTVDEVNSDSEIPHTYNARAMWNCTIEYKHPNVDDFCVKWSGRNPPTMQEVITSLCLDFRALESPEDFDADGRTVLRVIKEQRDFFRFLKECVTAQMCNFDINE